jgi:hypothetical protein
MKMAFYIDDGLGQIMLTPESQTEEQLLEQLHGDCTLSVHKGTFYDSSGGWIAPRQSTMIVLRPKKLGLSACSAQAACQSFAGLLHRLSQPRMPGRSEPCRLLRGRVMSHRKSEGVRVDLSLTAGLALRLDRWRSSMRVASWSRPQAIAILLDRALSEVEVTASDQHRRWFDERKEGES